ncbi:MAG: HlyD family efflux transporter periplasmic adaptor subunit [Cyanobacteria bacterium P01_D01_bin.105]
MAYKSFIEKSIFYKFRLYSIGVAIALLGASSWIVSHKLTQPSNISDDLTSAQPAIPQNIAAVGRIEPQGSIIKLSAANAKDSRVNEILVKEGDWVQAGQVIAILQGLEKQQAALVEAERTIAVQAAALKQAKSGTTTSADRSAQAAAIQRLESQLSTTLRSQQASVDEAASNLVRSKTEYERYQALYAEGAVSASQRDDRTQAYNADVAKLEAAEAMLDNQRETLTAQITEAQAKLERLDEVPGGNIEVSQAQLLLAQSQYDSVEAALEDYYVRAPIDGQILSINSQVGEQVSTEQGVVDLAQTEQMYVVAEVYETDVPRVKAGQKVTVVSENGGFTGELTGSVETIGLQIQKTDVLNTDPAADQNARVVEVKVRLDPEDSSKVAGLTYMQVRTKIHLNS